MAGKTLWDCETFEDAFKAMVIGEVNCEFYGLSWFLMHMHPSLPQDIKERYKVDRNGPVNNGEVRRIVEAYLHRYDIHKYDKYASAKHGKDCTYLDGVLLDLGFIPKYRDQVHSIIREYSPDQRLTRSRKRRRECMDI